MRPAVLALPGRDLLLGYDRSHHLRMPLRQWPRLRPARALLRITGLGPPGRADELRRAADRPPLPARPRVLRPRLKKESWMKKLSWFGLLLSWIVSPAAGQTPGPIVLKAARVFTSTSERPLAPG